MPKIKILILMTPFVGSLLYSQMWSPPVRVSPSGSDVFNSPATLVCDTTGKVWFAWSESAKGVFVKYYSYNDNTWSEPIEAYPPGLTADRVKLELDKEGNIWVIESQAGYGKNYARYYNGEEWSEIMEIPFMLSSFDCFGTTCDSSGNIFVIGAKAYMLFTTRWNGSSWSEAEWLGPGTTCYSFDIVTGKDGTVWLMWFGDVIYPDIWGMFVQHPVGDSWSDTSRVFSKNADAVLSPDTLGGIWAILQPSLSKDSLYFYISHYNGTNWSELDSVPNLACARSIVDHRNRLWVVWTKGDSTSDLWYAYYDGNNWSSPAPIDVSPGVYDEDPALAVDHRGIVWLAWYRYDPNDKSETGFYACHTTNLDIQEPKAAPVLSTTILQNYPNLFSSSTTIQFFLPEPGYATLKIYNYTGELIRILVNNQLLVGFHSVLWDGSDMRGRPVADGVYFCRIETGGLAATKRMVLLK